MFVNDWCWEFPSGDEGGLVADVGHVGPGHAGGQGGQLPGDVLLVQVGFEAAQVDFENGGPALDVGRGHVDLSVEPAGSQQRIVEDVHSGGGGGQASSLLQSTFFISGQRLRGTTVEKSWLFRRNNKLIGGLSFEFTLKFEKMKR